jgi:hypothetical protein
VFLLEENVEDDKPYTLNSHVMDRLKMWKKLVIDG